MKRPAKEAWHIINEKAEVLRVVFFKRDAKEAVKDNPKLRFAGPYILAERVRQL